MPRYGRGYKSLKIADLRREVVHYSLVDYLDGLPGSARRGGGDGFLTLRA